MRKSPPLVEALDERFLSEKHEYSTEPVVKASSKKWNALKVAAKVSASRSPSNRKLQRQNSVASIGVQPTFDILERDGVGQEPGIAVPTEDSRKNLKPQGVTVAVTDFSSASVLEHGEINLGDLDHFLSLPRPDWATVRWVEICGLDLDTMKLLAFHFKFDEMALEDCLHVPQRSNADEYDAHLFIVANMASTAGVPSSNAKDREKDLEQVSLFVTKDTVISVRDPTSDLRWPAPPYALADDAWKSIRENIQDASSKTRNSDASFLAYRIIDVLVDRYYVCLQKYQLQVEEIDSEVMKAASSEHILKIHAIERELLMLRRSVLPIQDMISTLTSMDSPFLSKSTKRYLRDVYQHSVQLVDIIENYQEFSTSAQNVCSNLLSQRLNDFMKVLTMISTIFIPGTFYAGVYGMNLDYIPELHFEYMYLVFWIVVLLFGVLLTLFFKHKRML